MDHKLSLNPKILKKNLVVLYKILFLTGFMRFRNLYCGIYSNRASVRVWIGVNDITAVNAGLVIWTSSVSHISSFFLKSSKQNFFLMVS